MDETRNELEVGNETMVMMYLNILKYAKHHCSENEDPYEITDRVFTDALVANNKKQLEDERECKCVSNKFRITAKSKSYS